MLYMDGTAAAADAQCTDLNVSKRFRTQSTINSLYMGRLGDPQADSAAGAASRSDADTRHYSNRLHALGMICTMQVS